MTKIVTIVAQYNGEYREVFNIQKGGDKSIYLQASSEPNPHISLHKSGVFHVVYPQKDGKKMYITIEGGQPFSSFKGYECPSEHLIDKRQFNLLKKIDVSAIKGEMFLVDLDKSRNPIVNVATCLFDSGNKSYFESQALKYPNSIKKIIDSITPNIGLIAF